MSKKLILAIIFFSYHFAYAGLVINEIMYDFKTDSDEGREWVEIFNNSDAEADLSSFKFFEADTNHKLKLTQGSANIFPRGYAIIVSDPVKFKIDWPSFSGTIFDSSFSLSNDGEILAIKDENLNIIDQSIYNSAMGARGDGKSLQKISGVWIGAMPTPGTENKIAYASPFLPSSPVKKSEPVPVKASSENTRQDTLENEKKLLSSDSHSNLNVVPEPNIAYVAESASFPFPIIILILLLGAGGGAVYFIRRKKIIPQTGDDFEILDG